MNKIIYKLTEAWLELKYRFTFVSAKKHTEALQDAYAKGVMVGKEWERERFERGAKQKKTDKERDMSRKRKRDSQGEWRYFD